MISRARLSSASERTRFEQQSLGEHSNLGERRSELVGNSRNEVGLSPNQVSLARQLENRYANQTSGE